MKITDKTFKKVGFTGTQAGMSEEQRKAVTALLDKWKPKEVHHGDCVGADEQFHKAAILVGCFYGGPVFHIHPPSNQSKRAFCAARNKVMHKKKPYLDRDRDVVDQSNVLIATPKEKTEQRRSGTWYTIRYAKKRGKPIFIIYPDGSFEAIKAVKKGFGI
jgi:hypothetical protein